MESQEGPVTHVGVINFSLPKLKLTLEGGYYIEIDDKKVETNLPLSEKEFSNLLSSIEDNFWEFQKREQEQEYIKDIIKSYLELKPSLSSILQHCTISICGNIAFINIPENLQKYAGLLIGKKGANAKYVEAKTGFKIKVIAKPSEEVEMKNRLRSILNQLDIT